MRSRQVKILELHMEGNQKAWPWRLRGRDSCAAEVQELQQAKKKRGRGRRGREEGVGECRAQPVTVRRRRLLLGFCWSLHFVRGCRRGEKEGEGVAGGALCLGAQIQLHIAPHDAGFKSSSPGVASSCVLRSYTCALVPAELQKR